MRLGDWRRWLAAVAGLLALAAVAGEPVTYHIRAGGYYARETTDGDWYLRLTGSIPSLCGAYLIVLNTEGKAIFHGVIPHGEYPADKPFRIKVPADGVVGDYLLKIIGNQDDVMGLAVPLTELPYEVYGGKNFAVAHELQDVPVWFKLPEGQSHLIISAYKGHLQVLDAAGKTVGDTHKQGVYQGDKRGPFRFGNVMDLSLQPGVPYRIQRECFYFSSGTPLYLCFDPARWFLPDPRLDSVKWWEVVK